MTSPLVSVELPSGARRWLAAQGREPRAVEALTGDISLRRYLRIRLDGGETAILSHYPPDLLTVCRRFVNTTSLLGKAGVPVPRILATCCEAGLCLLEDAGDTTLYDLEGRSWDDLLPLYRLAIANLPRIENLSVEVVGALSPPLDADLLAWELDKSWELFLAPEGLTGNRRLAGRLRDALRELCAALGAGPLVPCHRDYMPRNLMVVATAAGERLLVLDHQDLRLGPRGYDLASLLNDSLFPPAPFEEALVAELLPGPAGRRSYRRAVVQRSLKAIGNYRDFARRGFERHLRLVHPTLARALASLAEVPELAEVTPTIAPLWRDWLLGATC